MTHFTKALPLVRWKLVAAAAAATAVAIPACGGSIEDDGAQGGELASTSTPPESAEPAVPPDDDWTRKQQERVCAPGSAERCTCDDGESGVTVCLEDASGFYPCVCDPFPGSPSRQTTVECGTTTCTLRDPDAYRGATEACCTDSAGCGVKVTLLSFCDSLNQPGTLDSDCPDLDIRGNTLQGCCLPDGNTCGYFETRHGMGCLNPHKYGHYISGVDCDGQPVDL